MSFERVVCGIRGAESLEAVRQADRLAPESAGFVLVGAVDAPIATGTPDLLATEWDAPSYYDPELVSALEAAEQESVEHARTEVRPGRQVETRVVTADPVTALLEEAGDDERALIALGVHERHRLLGILGGSVSTAVVHAAPCSVLLARPPADPERFPQVIVAGSDGSEPALEAVEVALEIAGRLGAEVRGLVARGGREGGAAATRARFPGLELVEDDRDPVDALSRSGADLVVVGRRGAGGLRSLGSVSERVAHKARCSVLVVR
jgi:nucleotide-binding universal stress UspA family protein